MNLALGFYPAMALVGALAVIGAAAAGAGERASADTRPIIRLPLSRHAPGVDGRFDEKDYADAVILGGSFRGWGVSPRPQSPTVYLKRMGDRLFIAVDNPLKPGERPSLRGAVPDNPGIAMGNAIEMFFLPHQPDGELLSYIQFIGNARGCIYDAISRPQVGVTYVAEYNVPWGYRNVIVPGHWYSEISTTFADIGVASTVDGEWFDFDIGRDGGTGPNGVHSYTMAYHEIQAGKGVRVIFDAAAPSAQWLSFGDFEAARFSPRLRLVGNGRDAKVSVRVALHAPDPGTDGSLPLLWEESRELLVPAAGTAEATFAHDLAPGGKGVARYSIKEADGTVLFHRELPYQANATAAPLYEQTEAKPLVVTARMAPSYGRIGVAVDVIDYSGDKSRVAVEAVAKRGGQILGRARLDRFQLDYATGILEVGALAAGLYEVDCRMIDRDSGTPIGPTQTVRLERKIHEWENNGLGQGDEVPEPWAPIDGAAFRVPESQVLKVWGRDYRFNGLALPASIPTRQPNPALGPEIADVLVDPIRIVSEIDGRPEPWREGKLNPGAIQKSSASLAGSGRSPTLAATVEGTLDFDGFYKVRLRLEPTVAGTEYSSIRVEVPVPTASARLFHCVGESMRVNKTFADFGGKGDGVLWDSRSTARNALVKGNFMPVAWLGDEDRGIAWMCDNDRTWQTAFDKPCLDVVRKGGETAFRMHLLNRPGKLSQPMEVVFSLQATPVRPRPAGGLWKGLEWYGWGHFDMPLIYHGAFDAYAKGELPPNGPWYRTLEAKAQNRWWRYGCFNSDRIPVSDPDFGAVVSDFGSEWYSESVFGKYQNRSHQDFELWAWKQWHDKASMDGIYFDNTFPAPSLNELNGTAWIDDEGRLRPGYGVMAYREFMKRLRVMLLGFGPAPVLKAHITDTPIPGYLGFCDFWMDGENGGYPDPRMKNPDFVDRWHNPTGMANLRITCGQQWGAIPQYLYDWGIEPTHAVLGLFDLPNSYMPMGERPYHDFGLANGDVRYVPYWSVNPPVTVAAGGPDVLLTVWKRPGQARVLVSNLSGEDRKVTLAADLAALGLGPDAVAFDEREGGIVAASGGRIGPIGVPRHDYQALIVAAPGRYTPLTPGWGAKLLPERALRIERLCDDFGRLDPAWTPRLSPQIQKATSRHDVPSDALAIRWGHLRIRTGQAIHANLIRPFDVDGVSVQVRIRAPGCYVNNTWGPAPFSDGFGPALALSWADGREIKLTGFEGGPGRNFYCVGKKADGAVQFRKSGASPSLVNLLRIELHDDALVFLTGTDGETWQELHRQPRAGFEGAPVTLRLGHGERADLHAAYTIDTYYDDLIVARLPQERR